MYTVTKTYGPELGWACVYRNWKATSHCRFLHGYAVAMSITFLAETLDEKGWVVDFGSMKDLKEDLAEIFDHKLLIDPEDPERDKLNSLHISGIADVILMGTISCEAFAEMVYLMASSWLYKHGQDSRCKVHSVTFYENSTNAATYYDPEKLST